MLYLASRSPRRRELLARLGLAFEPIDLDIPEQRQPGETAEAYVRRVSCEKAVAGWSKVTPGAGALVLGADTEVICSSLARHAPDVPVRRVRPGDDEPMIASVRAARTLARPGDVVLLAPAAASLDMFRDYAHRGDAFTEAVRGLLLEDDGDHEVR